MTTKEQRIRQFWIWAYILSFAIGNIGTYLFPPPYVTSLPLVIGSIIGLLGFWLIVNCAYKKPGTKLLTFFIWVAPIGIVFLLVSYFFLETSIRIVDWIVLPVNILWYGLCFPMRAINRKMKKSDSISAVNA